MRIANLNIWLLVWVLVVVLAGSAAGRTIKVDPNGSANFTSIQDAIDDANDYDEIEVAPGTYNEAINFNGKAVRLYSSVGPEVTTIDGTGAYHVVQCVNNEDANTILEGFTITGGNANGSFPDNCGGGMFNNGSNPTVTDCTFSANTSFSGAGMLNSVSNPKVTNCTFTGNTADDHGGGMYSFQSSPTVTNCTFTNNSAYWDGGGMYNFQSSPTLTNCTFSDNSAPSGGGMCNWDNSNPPVTNCTFTGNSADYDGGGMENYPSSSPSMTNCTFSGNSAGRYGGGIDNWDNSNPTVTNCILWGNMPDEIYDDGTSTTTVTYSNVQDGWPNANNTNIDADPLFVDPNNPDPNLRSLRLKPDSPCIDAGDTKTVPGGIWADLGGNPRVSDDPQTPDTGLSILGLTVDMGAYEFYCSSIPGDINCDGVVDFKDLAILCGNWLAGTETEL